MRNFTIYLQQRFNLWLFTALSLYVLLFAKASFQFEFLDSYQLIFVLIFLLTMRLYDDLQSTQVDRGKPDRIYTDPKTAKELTLVLAGLLFLFLTGLLFFDRLLALYAFLFFSINHIIYLLLFNKNDFRSFLPLLKYPALVWAIAGQLSFNLPALFLGFIVFEAIEDKEFPIRRSFAYFLAAIAFGFLLVELPFQNAWFVALLFAISALVIFINSRYSPYIFLALLLLSRLTLLVL